MTEKPLIDQIEAIGNAIADKLAQDPKPQERDNIDALEKHADAIEAGEINIGLPEQKPSGDSVPQGDQ